MIKLLKEGTYLLGESKKHTRFLYLDKTCYVWVIVLSIGDILSKAVHTHEPATVLSKGRYKLYDIKNEPDLVDLKHLELEVEDGEWQGYLLLTGLPRGKKRRSRIVPTTEKVADYMEAAGRKPAVKSKRGEEVGQ